jgi:diguanylate cyclase (GGDEF)-like protein
MHFAVPNIEASDFQKKIPILTFIGGTQVGRRVLLADDTITLGRSPASTIMLNDQAVSRLHMEIGYDHVDHVYVVKDLGSSNGTMVNGKMTTRCVLSEGDKIILGHTVLRFSWIDAVDRVFHGEVDKLMNVDGLTGLLVKRRFDEEYNRHLAVALRDDTPMSMLMMDMDGLKQTNDTYGHAFGSYAISETGGMIKTIISSKGLASRFGGDEFMAFLSQTPLQEGKEIAEKIRQTVAEHAFKKDGITFDITISIGVSELQKNDTPETLLKRADEALYISKKSGRNKVSVSIM